MQRTSSALFAAIAGALFAGATLAQPVEPTPPPSPSENRSPTGPTGGVGTNTSRVASGAYNTAPDTGSNVDDNSRLAALLPAGVSSEAACAGFNSLEQCGAALHAAQNLNINFTDLKRKVANGERLEPAIHTLKPSVDARAEADRAQQQARADFRGPQG